jgi:hypothetical protein
MPLLEPAPSLDKKAARRQLRSFRNWLESNRFFAEREGVSALRSHERLLPLIGMYGLHRAYPVKHRLEPWLSGCFRADYVAGRPGTFGRFVLCEFEGAEHSSLFRAGGAVQMRRWSRQVERGLSQVADWSWLKNDQQHSVAYRQAFESDHVVETYVVVCGRLDGLDALERSRLHWRASKTSIASDLVILHTWDELANHFETVLDVLDA